MFSLQRLDTFLSAWLIIVQHGGSFRITEYDDTNFTCLFCCFGMMLKSPENESGAISHCSPPILQSASDHQVVSLRYRKAASSSTLPPVITTKCAECLMAYGTLYRVVFGFCGRLGNYKVNERDIPHAEM